MIVARPLADEAAMELPGVKTVGPNAKQPANKADRVGAKLRGIPRCGRALAFIHDFPLHPCFGCFAAPLSLVYLAIRLWACVVHRDLRCVVYR